MVTVHVSEAEARRLGLDTKAKVRSRKTARGRYWTRCTSDGLEFHSRAAEDRHLEETGHPNYRLIIEEKA